MTGSSLRILMQKHRWTQQWLAAQLDRSERMIRYYRAGEYPIDKPLAIAIRSLAAETGRNHE